VAILPSSASNHREVAHKGTSYLRKWPLTLKPDEAIEKRLLIRLSFRHYVQQLFELSVVGDVSVDVRVYSLEKNHRLNFETHGKILAENASQDIENHVEAVVLGRADVREAWTEQATQYATVGLHWSARDYTVSTKKQRGEPGYLIEGSDETAAESSEVWTFMRFHEGKWLLSAIQQ